MKSKGDLYDFLNSYTTGVISTVKQDGTPEAAIVGFGQTNNLELLFATNNTTRKYLNLALNPHVAFAIGGGQTPETIQYEGIARELDRSELDVVRDNYWQKNPFAKRHDENPSNRYFIVTPTWLRYTDLRSDPWDITELQF